ncbi:hypothetical protein MJL48_29025, partial [Salmonella enterica subsp. enterica serovar Kentucky]|nr:hypothetical protein [Salmonella enterica subsp. enterica serovar Kentucky]
SSLSGSANEDHIRKVKADGYVAKFEINELSSVIQEVLERAATFIILFAILLSLSMITL